MKYITLLVILLLSGCTTATPLCRHTVLAQYAACIDAGYETELVQYRNHGPASHPKHVVCRIRVNGKWRYLNQPKTTYTTTTNPPPNTTAIGVISFKTVAGWVIKREKR